MPKDSKPGNARELPIHGNWMDDHRRQPCDLGHLAAKATSVRKASMQRFTIILIICVAGCSNQSNAPTPSTTQSRDTAGRAEGGNALLETTVGGILLQPKTVISGKLTLLIPHDFSIMDEESLRLKYPSERRPTLVYTNESGSINIAINHTKDLMPQNRLRAIHKQMDGIFRSIYPSATWFESGIIDINGREWLTLNLRAPAIDTEIRNIIVGTSVEGRQLLVSFNVITELEDEWLEPAGAIVQSLRIED